jgi:hypothetical protein
MNLICYGVTSLILWKKQKARLEKATEQPTKSASVS